MRRLPGFCFSYPLWLIGLFLGTGLAVLPLSAVQASEWQDLFDGSSLEGWQQKGGEARYFVEKGELVGVSMPNTPNSFMTTKEHYGDFILEFEVKVATGLNSGVQIRSNTDEDYRAGQVHGYQVEIDTSPRGFSGGIYDEQRRGWLYPLSRNDSARSAFRNGTWNHFRVEAVGNRISTWVNGVQASRLVDDTTAKGFIGLQVHSINDPELAGREIRWRNIRISTEDLHSKVRADDPRVDQISYLKNTLTEWEKRKGWRLLWDGETTAGWRGAQLDKFPSKGWKIDDGVLTVLPSGGGEASGGGDIITEEQFRNFELEVEFQLTEGANSGIKYFVDPELNMGPGSAIGPEFQLLDNDRHPDAAQGVDGNRTLSSLYDLITAENLSIPGRAVQFKGIGAWNHARIVVRDGLVEHWLNHEKVVEYDRHSQMFRALVAYSKYRVWDNFGQWPQGHLLLQDHGNRVHFKNIKVREF